MTYLNSEKKTINYKVEFTAGLATFLTLSYVLLLNPVLLSKTGMNISAAFFATVVSAMFSTILMGYNNLPFAVAPAPSITTFFVSYVCLKLGLSWEAALAAVILSGILSISMTYLSVRAKLIDSIPFPLRIGVIFSISGFLIANGFVQGKFISFKNGFFDFDKFDLVNFISPNATILYTGLFVTIIFRSKWIRFLAAPILGIIIATVVASIYGIKSTSKAQISFDMFSSIGKVDFSSLFKSEFLISMIVFFIIDFFGGVGKYIGLFAVMGDKGKELQSKGMGNALYVDGIGNIIGGLLGASSLAVFVSSAVGIKAGGKTGWTAYSVAVLMLLSFFIIPLVGAIPVEATSGVLIYVGILLIPFGELGNFLKNKVILQIDIVISIIAAMISFFTYGIDKAILFVFLIYTLKIIFGGAKKSDIILIVTTFLLLLAIIAQEQMKTK